LDRCAAMARGRGGEDGRGPSRVTKSLLDDDDGDGDGGQEEARITVNEAYAKRFVHNKEREDLHRLQELKKKGLADSEGDDDDDDSEEEDEDGLLPVRTDAQIFETLARIKKRDPSIYVSEAKFYDEEEEEDGREEGDGVEAAIKEKKKKKPLYLKDVVARQLLDGGADEDEEDENLKKKKRSKTRTAAAQQPAIATYADEQQELKNAFLQSVAEADSEADDDGGEILSDPSFTRGFGLF
jgi:protein KRI1